MNKFKYAPILKWKAAEKIALKNVCNEDKQKIIPIIELVMPSVSPYKKNPITKQEDKKTDIERHEEIINKFRTERIDEIPDELLDVWGSDPLILDFSLLYGEDTVQLKIESIQKILSKSSEKKLSIIPLINLSDDNSIIEEVLNQVSQKNVEDIGVRITIADLSNVDELNKQLKKFFEKSNTSESNIHLLIDLKYLDDNISKYYGTLFNAAQLINNLDKWKSFIFASGSFPVNMSEFKIENNPSVISRIDWLNWNSLCISKRIRRVPLFSDYTTRNPIYNESLEFHEPTSSLKYTVGDDWYMFKGKRKDRAQYLGHANLLVNSTDKFYGEDYSFGDKYISTKAEHLSTYLRDPSIKGTGRTYDWIAASISHHLALVLSQLSNYS